MADTETTPTEQSQNNVPRVGEIVIPKRGRGRPPGSKSTAPGVAASKNPAPARASAPPDAELLSQAKFIGTGMVALVELGESFVHGNAARRIEKHRPEKLEEFKDIAERLALQDKEKEIIETSVAKLAERYEWMTTHAPEFLLCVTVAQYGLRQLHLLKFVNEVTKARPKEAGSKNAVPAGAVENASSS